MTGQLRISVLALEIVPDCFRAHLHQNIRLGGYAADRFARITDFMASSIELLPILGFAI
jgi:hypothetical protein